MLLESLLVAFEIVVSWPTPVWILVGLCIGLLVGATPAIGPDLGMAVILPLTLPLDGIDAIILLISVYSGGMYGGSIPAILLNVPGTASNAATTFDGYPLSKQGKAITALAMSATASSVGGFITILALIFLSAVLVDIVLLFGSPEYFLIALLGLTMITIVSRGSMVKGLAAGFFGLSLTTIGIAPMAPTLRYTFGSISLYDGISFVAALVGLFAIGEMIGLAARRGGISEENMSMSGNRSEGILAVFRHPVTLLKSSAIGTLVGAIPGAGASVSNFVAYTEAVRSSKDSKSFGEGNEVGLIASESANNATVAGSLIPTFAFGIPGSTSTAVLLGGLLMHGLRPGPDLFTTDLHVTNSVLIALLVGNLVIFALGILFVTQAGYITKIDTNIIIPIVVVLAFVGGYTLRSNWFDIVTIVMLGIIGYFMMKHNYSIVGFILGVVLGPIAEENLARSLRISDGSLMIFVQKPLSLLIVILIVMVLFGPFFKPYVQKKLSWI